MNEQPSFNVVDRRFWAQPDETAEVEEAARKPSYVEELEQKLGEREAEITAMRAQYREATGEFENAKARLRRELTKEVETHRRTLLVELLDVLDNLDRAIDAAESKPDAEALLAGVAMVRTQFLQKLGDYGVAKQTSLGEAFDPARHDAVSSVPVATADDDGRIIGVIKEGYALGDSVLRPASVAVGRHGGEP